MTTSGITSFELTRNNIIESALDKIGALALGGTPTTEEYTKATLALNSLIMLLQTEGMPLWKREETSIALVNGINTYTVADAVKVPQLLLINTLGDNQWEIEKKSRYDFNLLPTTNGGVPSAWYGQPQIQDFSITIWPTPDATMVSSYSLLAISQKEFDSFTSSLETPDFPPYWSDALIYGLAVRLAPGYGVPLQDRQLLKQEYKEYKDLAIAYGDEDGSLFIMPNKDI